MVSIVELSPKQGPPGIPVRIFGTDFSPTPSENRVTFSGLSRRSGVPAAVISAGLTVLLARVPPTAVTGPITVTTSSGSATSNVPFVVETPARAPTPPAIGGIEPMVAAVGGRVSLRGRGFDPFPRNNVVRINRLARADVVAATPHELEMIVPPGAGSGRVVVSTPSGTTTSRQDLVIPPAPYTTADVAMTGRVAVGGRGKTVTVERPDALALSPCAILVFDGTAGQRLRLAIRESTMPAAEVSVFHPDGTAVLPPTVVWKRETEVLIDVPPLAFTGSHTVVVSPVAALTGTLIVAIVRGQ